MKKNLFLSGLFLCAMTLGVMSCGDDDKEDEIVPDPLETEKEYYIAGTVSDANGALSGATVALNDQSVTTDGQGVYNFTVTETGNYTVKFSASGKENLEQQVSIAAGAANRTQVTLNVKLAKAIDMSAGKTEEVKKDEDTTVEVAKTEEATEATPTSEVSIPAGAAEEGVKVTAVTYEEPQATKVEETTTAQQTETTSVTNVAVATEPANAKAQEDIEIRMSNAAPASADCAFDTDYMKAYKEETAATRAIIELGKVGFKDNNYILTIEKGNTIAGKYSIKVEYGKKADSAKTDGYNSVNGKKETARIENRDYNATDVTLSLEITSGWEYVSTPESVLKNAGVATELAASIKKYIEASEGAAPGLYTSKKDLKASISGNHVLFFGSKAKTQVKNYTFHLIVKGKKVTVTVQVKCYVGTVEEYTNAPISQHSGGTGN